jgi:hypothetical protein
MGNSFSYPLPDELYVNSFDSGKQFSAEYNGPEKITILVNKLTGEVSGVNPETHNEEYYDLFEVNSSENPEILYFILYSNEEYAYEYEEEILINGDIYKKIINPSIHDAYAIRYDYNKNEFKLDLIIKTLDNNNLVSNLTYIRNRLNFIVLNEEGKKEKEEEPGVSEDLLNLVQESIKDIDSKIEENSMFMGWKYTNFDTILENIITIPEEIKGLLNTYE